MPADIGEMFYTGQIPWHGLGLALTQPATLDEAIKAGGLDWEVGEVDLMTADDPPSPVRKRKALVRLDRPSGSEDRVLGVAHRGFKPLQNKEGAMLFDAIFGHGERVYHTGGYLGKRETVWLLAKINKTLEIAPGDVVEPYALFANSHDGSMAFHIRLTTVRVVCSNTLAMAMKNKPFGEQFRRAHQGTFRQHAEAAQQFFGAMMKELDFVSDQFTFLTKKRCSEAQFKEFLSALLPEPKKPRNAEANPGIKKVWENKVEDVRSARKMIVQLTDSGKGMQLDGSKGTFWGVLNAVIEFVDHHKETKGSKLAYALLGDGMELKIRAFRVIHEMATAA